MVFMYSEEPFLIEFFPLVHVVKQIEKPLELTCRLLDILLVVIFGWESQVGYPAIAGCTCPPFGGSRPLPYLEVLLNAKIIIFYLRWCGNVFRAFYFLLLDNFPFIWASIILAHFLFLDGTDYKSVIPYGAKMFFMPFTS